MNYKSKSKLTTHNFGGVPTNNKYIYFRKRRVDGTTVMADIEWTIPVYN